MTSFQSLNEIIRSGFCIGCGLCVSLAPKAHIEMHPNPCGHLRPRPQAALDPDEEERILTLCPGINVEGPFDPAGGRTFDPVWGENRRVARGHAIDPELRFRSSSGGVMTAVNRHLLRTGLVSFVLQTKPDPADPFGTIASLCRSEAELSASGGSRYATSAPLKAIAEALDLGEVFAVSLKPCDIAGLRNLQRDDPRARDLIRFTQAMFCGTVPNMSATRDFFERRGIDLKQEKPVSFRWRGNGCPGPTRAVMPSGQVVDGTYNELWLDNPWTTQFRCKVCPDAVGLQADIAVGDDWPDGAPEGEDDGWNVVIAHSVAGSEVLQACEEDGDLLLQDVDIRHLEDVQPHHARLRRGVLARLDGCSAAGLPDANFTNLALAECAEHLTSEERVRNFQGTTARLFRGPGGNLDVDNR